jgi:hypothetical protein
LSALGIHSPPGWAIDAGKHIMGGLLKGIAHGAADVRGFFRNIALDVAGPFKGIWSGLAAAGRDTWHFITGLFGGGPGHVPPASGSALAAQNYARQLLSMYGWGQDQMSSLIPLWNQESGWNANAVNPSSGAYGIPQSLGHGHPYDLGDYKNQVIWGLNYIRGRYGSPAGAWAHERAFNWYAGGTPWALPGWAWVGERGPELVRFRGGEQVAPVRAGPGRGRGGDTYVFNLTVNAPVGSSPRDIGRQLADLLGAHIKGGGRIYPQGVVPRLAVPRG